jgi:hypothetical protein
VPTLTTVPHFPLQSPLLKLFPALGEMPTLDYHGGNIERMNGEEDVLFVSGRM